MPEHFSDDELRRISAFARRPMYEREPEQLLPDVEDEDCVEADEPTNEGYGPARDDP